MKSKLCNSSSFRFFTVQEAWMEQWFLVTKEQFSHAFLQGITASSPINFGFSLGKRSNVLLKTFSSISDRCNKQLHSKYFYYVLCPVSVLISHTEAIFYRYTVHSELESGTLFIFWIIWTGLYLSFCHFLLNKSPNFSDFFGLLFETVFYSKQSSITELTININRCLRIANFSKFINSLMNILWS